MSTAPIFVWLALAVIALLIVVRNYRRSARHGRLVEYVRDIELGQASDGLADEAPDAIVAMFEAAARGHIRIMADARAADVPIDARDGVGRTPLIVAAASKNRNAVEWLVDHGADVDAADMLGETALLQAARHGDTDVVLLLLDREAEVDPPHSEGWTPLLAASLNGWHDTVKILLEHGANRQAKTMHDFDAVTLAQKNGHFDVVATLRRPARR